MVKHILGATLGPHGKAQFRFERI